MVKCNCLLRAKCRIKKPRATNPISIISVGCNNFAAESSKSLPDGLHAHMMSLNRLFKALEFTSFKLALLGWK